MAAPDPTRVAVAFQRESPARSKTAGEVRFIKDRADDKSEWGWNIPAPQERDIHTNFVFQPRHLKPLATVLRSTLMALGHVTSAHSKFVKVKSRNVSPDGNLGGKGYIQKITDMRRQLMNCIEALSATSDTLFDELHAPHWDPAEDKLDARDREEVREIVEDAEEIKEDPEGWAEDQEDEMDDENEGTDEAPPGKTASLTLLPGFESRVARLAKMVEGRKNPLRILEEAEAVRRAAAKLSHRARLLVPSPSSKRVAARYLENPNV